MAYDSATSPRPVQIRAGAAVLIEGDLTVPRSEQGLVIGAGATQLLEEPGALAEASRLALICCRRHLERDARDTRSGRQGGDSSGMKTW